MSLYIYVYVLYAEPFRGEDLLSYSPSDGSTQSYGVEFMPGSGSRGRLAPAFGGHVWWLWFDSMGSLQSRLGHNTCISIYTYMYMNIHACIYVCIYVYMYIDT